MEEKSNYKVVITAEAESFFLEILAYFYKHHSARSAERKSAELLDMAVSLEMDPQRGTVESKLNHLKKGHKFILYYYTPRKAIKVIYFIDESINVVYVTDFFPCEMEVKKITGRSK